MGPKTVPVNQIVKELLISTDFKQLLSDIVQDQLEDICKRLQCTEQDNKKTDLKIAKFQTELSSKISDLISTSEKVESSTFDADITLREHRKSLENLEQKLQEKTNAVKKLEGEVNNLEQYSRRTCLRIFGIKEMSSERTDDIVVDLAKRIEVSLQHADIDRSHRVGTQNANKKISRPIIVKLTSYRKREDLLRNRRKLKSTGITIQEDLTARNRTLLQEAYAKFKQNKVSAAWSSDGRVFVALPTTDGKKTVKKLISCHEDLRTL